MIERKFLNKEYVTLVINGAYAGTLFDVDLIELESYGMNDMDLKVEKCGETIYRINCKNAKYRDNRLYVEV